MEIKKWKTIQVEESFNFKIFQAKWVKQQNPINKELHRFIRLDSLDWVNIIPLTKDKQVVMIEQYRHGIDEITLEIPGGLIDKMEKPIQAAMRECIEETGFAAEEVPILVGMNHPNPAFLNNRCYSFLWKNVEKKYQQKLDTNEIINIKLIPICEINSLIKSKVISHSLVLNAFFFMLLNQNWL